MKQLLPMLEETFQNVSHIALAGVAEWIERVSANQKVASLIGSQDVTEQSGGWFTINYYRKDPPFCLWRFLPPTPTY